MARFLPVLLAAVALLAAGPATAEGFWRGVLKSAVVVPDAILRRFHTDTSTVREGVTARGTGRSTSGLDYDDYTRQMPAAAARKEAAAPFGYDYRAAPRGGARRENVDGGTAKGAGRSTSGLDYDDYTLLPAAAGKEEKAAPFGYDYRAAPSGARGDDVPFNYSYKAPSKANKATDDDDDDVPFNYDYKEPRRKLGGTDDGGEATSESGDGAKTVGAPFNYSYKGPSDRRAEGGATTASEVTSEESKAGNKEAVGTPYNYSYRRPSGATTASVVRRRGEATSEESEARNKETVGAPYNYSYKGPSGATTVSKERAGRQKETAAATTTVFFHEESVRVGARLRFRFPAASPAPLGLLPRSVADSVPFSTAALPAILSLLRVPPGSAEAADMTETLRTCEWPPLAGDSKFCASSIEALVEHAMATLGTRDVRAVTSALPRAGAPLQAYAVRAVRRVDGAGFVACHDEVYPYTVYRCHTTGPARAYLMDMEGAGGIKITVATVCHTDTSRWNPDHLSFKLLGTRPGGTPICHLMPYGHIIWAKNLNRSPA